MKRFWNKISVINSLQIFEQIEKFVETQKRQNTYYLESLFTEGPGKIGVVFYLSATTSDKISGQCDSRAESKGIIKYSWN